MQIIQSPESRPIMAWVDGVEFDDFSRQQLMNIAKMPFIFKHIAAMPDCHAGIGATVGSVIATQGAIIPAAVGVDLGCGMMALRTSLRAEDLPDDLSGLRAEIERRIPHGRTDNGQTNDRGAWYDIPNAIRDRFESLRDGYITIADYHPLSVPKDPMAPLRQLGTLGTGNHFIEVCLDEEDYVWIMLHSGSRGVGNRIGTYFIEQAKNMATQWMYDRWLPDKDLAYLPEDTLLFQAYMYALSWAQEYALANREVMMSAAVEALKSVVPGRVLDHMEEAVSCHHNYVARENHFNKNVIVTRKGAVRARKTDLGIIPGSMGARSFIVRGKGNRDSFESCSHGAGRRMSRTQAKREFTLDDLEFQTMAVECRKDKDVIDEIPGAYKSIDAVMAAQRDLVEIVHTLKQVLCVKG